RPACGGVRREDRLVLHPHPPESVASEAQLLGLRGGPARRLHGTSEVPGMSAPGLSTESVAVVIVTYNRADLLVRMLDGLAAQTRRPDAVVVVDNASSDHTGEVLAARTDLPLHVITSPDNLGGAGGFHLGMKTAHEQGFDRSWLVDDDVVPAPDCLEVLMASDEDC